MIWALVGTYLFGAVCWFFITLMNWSVDRQYPTLHTETEVAAKARLVLQTPIWPLTLMGMAGRTIGRLQKDVMR